MEAARNRVNAGPLPFPLPVADPEITDDTTTLNATMKLSSILIPAVLCAVSMGGASCAGSGTSAREEGQDSLTVAQGLIRRLQAIEATGKTVYGHDDDPVYGVKWTLDSGRSDVLEVVGDYPGMMHWDLGMIELGAPVNLDSVPFDRMRAEMAAQEARGGLNAISWHPRNPRSGLDAWQPVDTDVVTLAVTPGTPENDTLKVWLDRAADYLASLKDSRGNPLPLIFRPWHEMSGGWFWWGGPNTTVDSYVALWKMTREAFDAKGLTNIVWAYSPDVVSDRGQYMTWYPGDEMVDILGADVYHRDGDQGTARWFDNIASTLGAARAVAKEKGKIAALTETGCEGLPVLNWYTDCMLPVIRRYHPVYMTVWRNGQERLKPGHFYAPYPGHPEVVAFRTFHADSLTLFAREVREIR